jgi:hypothetical protein
MITGSYDLLATFKLHLFRSLIIEALSTEYVKQGRMRK